MWNYSFMFPSVMVLFTILFFYFTRPRLSIRINRTYLGMLVLEILIILFDILSSWADENHERFAPWALYALNTAFFVLYFGRVYGFFPVHPGYTAAKRSATEALVPGSLRPV